MDRIGYFREVIESITKEYARLFNQQPEGIDVLALCDEDSDTYAVVNVGWDGNERMDMTSVLMRIVNDKIWVEKDKTMYGFVDELLNAGISHSDIVLAFHPPKMRQHTPFAVA